MKLKLRLIASAIIASASISSAVRAQVPDANLCAPEIESRIANSINSLNYENALTAANEREQAAIAKFGHDSRCYAAALGEKAVILKLLNRGIEAEPMFKDALALARQYSAPDDPILTLILNNYGVYLFSIRRYDEAAKLHEEALELRKRHNPVDQSAVAESLHNLADAYRYLNRPADTVEKLYQDALALKLSLNPRNDVSIAQTRQNLASAQENLGHLKDASESLMQALATYRRDLKPDDPRIAGVLGRLGSISYRQGAYKDAEAKYREALALQRGAHTQQATLAATLDDFAVNQIQLGRYDEAISLASEALTIRRKFFPENNPTIARSLSNLSYLAWLKRNYDESLARAREASDITTINGRMDQASRFRYQRHLFSLWAKATAVNPHAPPADLAEEAFAIGQQAIRSDTAETVAKTALRFSARDSRLRDLLKEVDDIDRASDSLEQSLTHALTLPANQADTAFSNYRSELSANALRRKTLLDEIERSFPDYARLVNPKPLSVATVQSLLKPDEALLTYVVGFEDVFAWSITRDRLVWQKVDIDPRQLEKAVGVLREGLDVEPEDPLEAKQALFNLGLANSLYAKLLAPFATEVASKSKLIVVPSGPLVGLPLHLLVTSKPSIAAPSRGQPEAFRKADWLLNRFAVSEIPSVESLEALRRRAQPSPNRKPLIGFANPLPSPEYVAPDDSENKIASADRGGRGQKSSRDLPPSVATQHDVAALRRFLEREPLRSSGPELRDVAKIVGADDSDLYIGPRATETELRKANLASYRIVYFATHGYLPGSYNEGEPALALTVPDQPTQNDDGLLTASEITQLTLDADWVVLSACDTASGNGKGAEGLSGLARAFFHAGARALLVANWSLDDISAQEIMKGTFEALQREPALGKAQALRKAMLDQIKGASLGDTFWDAYPGRWAAFEVVGVD